MLIAQSHPYTKGAVIIISEMYIEHISKITFFLLITVFCCHCSQKYDKHLYCTHSALYIISSLDIIYIILYKNVYKRYITIW